MARGESRATRGPSVPVEGGSANDYEYVGGDPVGLCDLSGQFAVAIPVALAAGMAAYAAYRAMSGPQFPSKKDCQKAIKFLTQYERLFREQRNRPLDPRRLEELDRKRREGTIRSDDLPGSLKGNFPGGMLEGLTLNQIRELCGWLYPPKRQWKA